MLSIADAAVLETSPFRSITSGPSASRLALVPIAFKTSHAALRVPSSWWLSNGNTAASAAGPVAINALDALYAITGQNGRVSFCGTRIFKPQKRTHYLFTSLIRFDLKEAHQGSIEELMRAATRKVIVSCFASSIPRIQQILDIAAAAGRKAGFIGRSMVDNVEIAHGMNRLRIPDGLVVRTQDIASFPADKLVVMVSGSQAEPMSSLSRVAVDTHRLLTLNERDTVNLSARIIPGNEKAIFRMLDHMLRKRALVYYDNDGGTIHVSGHASQEEQKLLLNLVRPRYFIPVHGEFRQLFRPPRWRIPWAPYPEKFC